MKRPPDDLTQPARGYNEIIRRLNAVKRARGLSNKKIAELSRRSENTVRNVLKGNVVSSYCLVDVIDALGLEIQVI